MKTLKTIIGLLLVLTAFPSVMLAQQTVSAPIEPIPAGEQSMYKFDFTKFYKNKAAVDLAIANLKQQAVTVQQYRGKVTSSAENLYQVLILTDSFAKEFNKLYNYLDLHYDTNTLNTAPHQQALDLEAQLSPDFTFVPIELQKLTEQQLDHYIQQEPRLAVYKYSIEQSLRQKPYTLSIPEETILTSVSPLIYDWSSDEYNLLMDRASWGSVVDPSNGQTYDVRQDGSEIDNSPLRSVRKEGFDKTNAAFKQERDLFAFDVIHVARTQNEIAKLHHFKNGQSAAFFNDYLSDADVDNAFNQILGHGDIRKQYQQLSRSRIQQFTGYDFVHSYDMSLVPPGVVKPRFTIDQARNIVLGLTAYLGPEYTRQMSALLDPNNGRLDIVAGPQRVPNAFCTLTTGYNSVFYDYGYQGYLDDVSTLAHEAGHGVDNALENDNKVIPSNSDGPRYFTESYAILNEFVLRDYLYQHETDPKLRVYYLQDMLGEMTSFYGNTRIAAIEKAIYEGVDNGTVTDADDLDKLTYNIGSKVSIWYDLEPDTVNLWEQVPHYYSSPTYYINYVFADLLAETYFTMYKKDPIGFGKRFTALERNGFTDTPDHLLKKFLGIDLNNPHTFDAVFAQHAAYLDQLRELYKEVPVPAPSPGLVQQ
jgi:oligoendopeptidase F